MSKLSVLLLCAFLFVQGTRGNAQPLQASSLYDSLHNLLNYFYENTSDTGFKQAIEKAEVLCAKDIVTDLLAKELIYTENSLINLLVDPSVALTEPFKKEMILSFGQIIVNLLEPPVNENLLYAAALHNLGRFYSSSDNLKAYGLFEKALRIRKNISGEENPEYAETLFYLALIDEGKGYREKSLSMMLQALKITERTIGKENNLYADQLFYLANFYDRISKLDTALFLYEQQTYLRRKIFGDDNPRLAIYLCRTALTYIYIYQYKKALSLYQEAAGIIKRILGEENIQYAFCLNGIGGVYYCTAEYEQAIFYTTRALHIEEKLCAAGICTGDISVNLHDLAMDYQYSGRYETALSFFQEAISKEKENAKNNSSFAFDMPYLASLYAKMGKYEEAYDMINQTLNAIEKSNREYGIDHVRTLNFLGLLYTDLKKYQEAIPVFKKAIQESGQTFGKKHIEYVATLSNMAVAYKGMGMYDTAARLISEAAEIRKFFLGNKHPYYASSLNNLGDLCMLMGKYDSAEILFTQALAIRKKILGEDHPDYTASLNSLAVLYIATNNISHAVDLLAEANNHASMHIIQIYASLSEQEKIGYTINQSSQFSYLPSILFMNKTMKPEVLQQVYTNELALKVMVLSDQQSLLNSIRKSNDDSALTWYNDWRINKIILGKQLLLPVNERSSNFDSIREATNFSEQELSRTSAAFRQQHQILTAKNIAEKLTQGKAAIEFIKFNFYNKKFTDSILYAAMILLPGDSIPKFIPLCEEKPLANLLKSLGKNENSINRFYSGAPNIRNQLPNRGDSLYSLIWKPLEKYLDGINTIYYAPTGLLHRIAFEALPFDASNHTLINKYHLNQLLSTRSIVFPSSVTQKPSAINIWGNIQYTLPADTSDPGAYTLAQRGMSNDKDLNTSYSLSPGNYELDTTISQPVQWPPLPGTKLEIDSIKNIFSKKGISVTIVSDTVATEEAFKALDGKSPQILHIATHGFSWSTKERSVNNAFTIQQDPMLRSGLTFAGCNNIQADKKNIPVNYEDGILTAYEIAQMDLSNTDLVVLSACETALGDLQGNEGVIGLQRAFKLAGVKQMIISLWRVPDKQTVELMTMFYRNWLSGQSPGNALRSAQLKMKEKYSPYYWAAFVLAE